MFVHLLPIGIINLEFLFFIVNFRFTTGDEFIDNSYV